VYLVEHLFEIGGEGVEDAGTQGAGDVIDVVEQLGGRPLGVVVQADQTGVEGAELSVGPEGGLIGRL
jgi:hypothetical protein